MEFGEFPLDAIITDLMRYVYCRNVLLARKPSQRPMAPLSNVQKANVQRLSTLIALVMAMKWASCSQLCGRLRKKSFFWTRRRRRLIISQSRWMSILVTLSATQHNLRFLAFSRSLRNSMCRFFVPSTIL